MPQRKFVHQLAEEVVYSQSDAAIQSCQPGQVMHLDQSIREKSKRFTSSWYKLRDPDEPFLKEGVFKKINNSQKKVDIRLFNRMQCNLYKTQYNLYRL